MKLFVQELEKLLLESCTGFTKHALEHALTETKTSTDIVQSIINTQAAIEVIAKLFQLRNNGWESIIDKKHHSEAETELLEKLKYGNIKTNQYWRSKDFIENQVSYFSSAKPLLKKFQHYRNSVSHLGLVELPEYIEIDVLEVLVRVINTLSWDESMPNGNENLENVAVKLIGKEQFQKLLENPDFIDAVEDKAYEVSWSVKKCIECGCRSWGRTDLDEVLCFSCGYRVSEELIDFEDCPDCKEGRAVVYDKTQGHGNEVIGRCTECNAISYLAYCNECNIASPYREDWVCVECTGA